MIGSLGSIVFTTSDRKVLTFRDMSKQYAARYARHELIGKKPKLEFIGADLRKMSFSIRLDSSLGVNPQETITALTAAVEQGEVQAFMLGDEFIGNFVVMDIDEAAMVYNNRGRLRLADIKVSIEEYADD